MSGSGKSLMVMAGGTGGHIFPGLAVAHHLIAQGWQVRWLGTADRMEANLVPKNDIEIDFIRISGFRGKHVFEKLCLPWSFYHAVGQAKTIIKRYQPDVVLGMGGYVAGPGCLAAWLCGIPVVLHEQNSIAGLTNRWLSRIACKVLQAFSGAFPNAAVVGNPVRQDVLTLPEPDERFIGRQGPIRVLVMGGSQGARILNCTMPDAAARLAEHIDIWHQTGQGALDEVQQAYKASGRLQYKVTEFIDNIAQAYSWADVVVCRSGALTVSEISAAGVPAVFVPFQHKDRQQYWNACSLEKVGAAKIIDQSVWSVEAICDVLFGLDRTTLRQMAQRARSGAKRDATERVVAALTAAVHLSIID